MGDFNKILFPHEKLGGGPFNTRRADKLAGMIIACELSDLGFMSPEYTWTNL